MSITTGRIYLGATLIASGGPPAVCGPLIEFSAAYAQHGAGLWQAIGHYQPLVFTSSGTLGTASLHAASLYF